MTVAELIEEPKGFDPNMTVRFSYNYGDHWRTHVAPVVHSVEETTTKFSEYHNMDMLDEDSEKFSVVLS